MEKEDKNKHWIAPKINIDTLFSGNYIEQEEDLPNYILTSNEQKIYRFNIMGIVVDIEKRGSITNYLVDDGSGKIILRQFEENKLTKNLDVGDSVLIIGRLRKYNQEKYISPDIIKKIDPQWLKVRLLELNKMNKLNAISEEKVVEDVKKVIKTEEKDNVQEKQSLNNVEQQNSNKETIQEEIKEKEELINSEEIIIEDVETPPSEKIINLIKELDQGEGVIIEDLIEKSKIDDAEKIIDMMIENGEIFQNLPGKVKVL